MPRIADAFDTPSPSWPRRRRRHRPRYGRQEGHGKLGGRAESARLLDEIRNTLTEAQREMLRRGRAR